MPGAIFKQPTQNQTRSQKKKKKKNKILVYRFSFFFTHEKGRDLVPGVSVCLESGCQENKWLGDAPSSFSTKHSSLSDRFNLFLLSLLYFLFFFFSFLLSTNANYIVKQQTGFFFPVFSSELSLLHSRLFRR